MKIQYASDLHLEFPENSQFLYDNPIIPVGDILLLAGDIGYLNDKNYLSHPFWDWASNNFQQTLVIPGNHEFHNGYDLYHLFNGYCIEIRNNVKWYYNALVTINDIDFILTTLWTHISLENAFISERCIADFHQIRYNGNPFTSFHYNEQHKISLEFLYRALQNSERQKRVIVSHHVPSELCISEGLRESRTKEGFVVELDQFIHDKQINYWIYGHSHDNQPTVEINGTKFLCNQLGYVKYGENHQFNQNSFFEL